MRDVVSDRVEAILILNAAEAYGFRQEAAEPPCSLCGCALPARETAECDRPECPLEGIGRG